MEVGRAIRIFRETLGFKVNELAKEAELSVSMLSMIETGQREASLAVLRRIASCLNVPLDVLLAITQPGEGTLSSSDDRAKKISSALGRLERIEDELRTITQKRASAC